MPMNDATSTVYMGSSSNVGVSKAELYKSSGNGINSPGLSPGHALYSLQGQKWQQVFDFEKVLKQLRIAEKTYLRGKIVGSSDKNVLSDGGPVSREVVIQVQRLNAKDMHFFDIAPKQTARNVVICNTCMGYYTKMGFGNHVMINHPAIYDTISNKLNMTHASDIQIYNSAMHAGTAAEHSLDGIKDGATDIIGSPTDMSGTVSTCSSSSSSLSSPYTVPAVVAVSTTSMPVATSSSSSRHKSSSSKNISSSKSGVSSGSSSRSRNKSKHHHNTSSSTAEVSTHGSHKNSSNSSKKGSHSSSHNNSSGTGQGHLMRHSHNVKDAYDTTGTGLHISLYSSSSSNSSCSLPATLKIVGSTAHHDVLSNAILETGYSPANNANALAAYNDIKDKHVAEHANMVPIKKKAKSPAVLTQESTDSTTSSSTSSSEFERKLRPHHAKAPAKPVSTNQMPSYGLQIGELDQAVSSITGGGGGGTAGANESLNPMGYTQQNVLPSNVVEGQVQHNTSEDTSISLTLDDMLDTKFINEILNTAESEIPFDESVLDPALQQPSAANNQSTSYMQQPASKRIRYDDGNGSEMVAAGYTAVYQQQHPQEHQQLQYDGNNMPNIKLYNQSVDGQQMQDPQLTAIDAMQLQQLIYQQQQMLDAEQKQISVDGGYATLSGTYETQPPMTSNETTASNQQQQQFNVYNVPSLTDDNVEAYENIIMPSIIYEITANNQVTVMDQQSQQQVIAEFLTQAGYDNVEQMNVLTTTAGVAGTAEATDSSVSLDANCGGWADYNELCDIDFTKLETATTITSTSPSSSSSSSAASSETKTVKLEAKNTQQKAEEPIYPPHRRVTHTKYHEDLYFNVFLYNGVPRPITMNTFGLLKLPQGAAITFRKHLLTSRKANNSLLSIGSVGGHNMGGINGVISGSSTRYPLHSGGNSKQNFYGGSGIIAGGSGVGNVNEFSIGSITITNAVSNNCPNNQQSGSGGGINKHKSISGAPGVATTTRVPPTSGTTHVKTIHVNKSNTICNERIKCVKRALVSKLDFNRNGVFTAKKLNDLLSGKVKEKDQDRSEQQQDIKSDASESQQQQEQLKLKRMRCFYEKRRHLLQMSAGHCSQNEYHQPQHHHLKHQQQQQRLMARSPTMHVQSYGGISKQQRQEKLLKRQLIRTLSDSCGLNQWKSASNSPSAGSNSSSISGNDLMRVFV